MAKVFTITAGLENMGALKTGGQGSVYKGRRIGEVITAIKLLPTPIYSESGDDKNYIDFQNEVQKLKRVNEEPNPHVVTILSSGITDSGNFPYIEMEYIDGPDLEDLLKPPHERIFTVKEVLKVADQLSNALAHCHKLDVRHGDIKSNNVKFNKNTGNYILLDFGLSIMSDEQRRSSLRHAGAIEFMAPEQNEGQMLFQTDVYSFGVILYELLAGTVPFPLHDKGESARNAVRLSHMETPPPDLAALRKQAISKTSWDDAKKAHETQVPDWLLTMIYKCLEKKAGSRFANGIELNDYITLNSTTASKKDAIVPLQFDAIQRENEKLAREKEQLERRLAQYREQVEDKERDLDELKAIIVRRDHELQALREGLPGTVATRREGVSKNIFMVVLLLAIALGAYAAYTVFLGGKADSSQFAGTTDLNKDTADGVKNNENSTLSRRQADQKKSDQQAEWDKKKRDSSVKKTLPANSAKKEGTEPAETSSETTTDETEVNPDPPKTDIPKNVPPETDDKNTGTAAGKGVGLYTVDSKAYFYNEPSEGTRREAFINHWNNAVLAALNDKDGFIYVVYTNKEGQTSKGWLRKRDVTRINK
jgi:serine/threonine protein kinase